MTKIMEASKAVTLIKDGMSVMIGGFLGCGSPDLLIEEVVKNKVANLTIIANDTGFPNIGIGRLVACGQLSKIITSHIGTNPQTGNLMNSGEIEVELIPQGTLAERIRVGGAGLGGVLTPTGIGTKVEENKTKLNIEGKDYLLELPLKADIALIKAYKADQQGNLVFRYASRNFNPIMAIASDYVIAEVERYFGDEYIHPDEVMLPGIFVDAIVKGGEGNDR